MPFENRADAAHQLSVRLAEYRGRHPLVLAIPRGAVPMGVILARALDGELDVVLVRKLRAPFNPELAVGSIDETGATYLDPDATGLWDREYLEREIAAQLEILQARRVRYGAVETPRDPAERVVIVVDDGIATGSTMIAALRSVRARHPATLGAATAVAPPEALQLIRREADRVVCLETPPLLQAIGLHFRDFSQVTDEDVVEALAESRRWPHHDVGATGTR